MKKKTLKTNKTNKRNKRKGGNTIISNILGDKPGYFITENLQDEIDKGNKEVILNKYKINKEDAEKDYLNAERIKKDSEENTRKTWDRFQEFIIRIVGPSIFMIIKFVYNIITLFNKLIEKAGIVFKYISNNIIAFVYYLISLVTSFFKIIITSKGVILVVIVFAFIIFMIIFSANGFQMPNIFEGNDIIKNTYNKVTVFKNLKQETPYSILSQQLQGLIPDDYKNQYSKMINDFNKFFGKDTISSNIDTIDRDVITTGRHDGIYHIKKFGDNDKVYSIVRPKPLSITINNDNIPYTDYYKLPEDFKSDDKYNIDRFSIIEIPLLSNNGKYYNDIDNANYIYQGSKRPIKDNKYIPFRTSNIQNNDTITTFYNINHIPIKKFEFNNNDNINPNILKEKIMDINDSGNYIYPTKYINNIIKKLE